MSNEKQIAKFLRWNCPPIIPSHFQHNQMVCLSHHAIQICWVAISLQTAYIQTSRIRDLLRGYPHPLMRPTFHSMTSPFTNSRKLNFSTNPNLHSSRVYICFISNNAAFVITLPVLMPFQCWSVQSILLKWRNLFAKNPSTSTDPIFVSLQRKSIYLRQTWMVCTNKKI